MEHNVEVDIADFVATKIFPQTLWKDVVVIFEHIFI